MSASATIEVSASYQYTNSTALATFTGTPKIVNTTTLSSTVISKVYAASPSISTATTYNVAFGLTDAYGNALVYTTVQSLVIYNTSTSATLTVGGGTNPLYGTDQYTIAAGQCLPITKAVTVSGSAENIHIVPSAAATFQMVIAG